MITISKLLEMADRDYPTIPRGELLEIYLREDGEYRVIGVTSAKSFYRKWASKIGVQSPERFDTSSWIGVVHPDGATLVPINQDASFFRLEGNKNDRYRN